MQFVYRYPDVQGVAGDMLDPGPIDEVAVAAERAGFDAIAFTEHPAPGARWLGAGGHQTLDPFVALSFAAAATERIQLLTYVCVLPYRNPMLVAKTAASIDRLSGGRFILGVGTGYLKGEFSALGVAMEERNELFDEAVDVMRALWATDELHYEGRHFTARGVTLKPRPVQQPHPPLWLGGNAHVVRERVAAWGDGWAPLLGGAELLQTTRTSAIPTDADLARHIAEIKEAMAGHGRDPGVLDVASGSAQPLPRDASVQERLDVIGRLAEIGVTWTPAPFAHSSFSAALDSLRRFGEEVITPAR